MLLRLFEQELRTTFYRGNLSFWARLYSCHASRTSILIAVSHENTDACQRLFLCRPRSFASVQVWRFSRTQLRHLARRKFSIWPSVLRQPAHQPAAPKCHTPSPCGWPSCGGQCSVGCAGKPTHSSPQPWHTPPLPGTRNRQFHIVASKPSPPWCAALALSNSIRCKMQQHQTAKGARQWQCQASAKHVRLACSQRPLLRAPA